MLELSNKEVLSPQRELSLVSSRNTRVISVTSGKGGVGKSSVVANLATSLGQKGNRVLLLDGDFGLANLDILFDYNAKKNVFDLLHNHCEIGDVISRVAENVDIVPAGSGMLNFSSLTINEKSRLIELMEEVESSYDVLLIDTGAGINDDVTWLNSSANEIIVVVTPEPTSIADAYALIKILSQKHKIKNFKMLVNQAKTEGEAMRVYQHITSVSDKFLSVAIDYLGHVLMDELVPQAIRMRKPIVSAFPRSNAAKNFSVLADTLVRKKERSVPNGNVQFFWKALLGHA